MSIWGVAGGVALALAVNEFCDVCPWAAAKLVRWSARLRYPDPGRAEVRAEELAGLIDGRPGKLFKLITALGFVLAAIRSWAGRAIPQPWLVRSGSPAAGTVTLTRVIAIELIVMASIIRAAAPFIAQGVIAGHPETMTATRLPLAGRQHREAP